MQRTNPVARRLFVVSEGSCPGLSGAAHFEVHPVSNAVDVIQAVRRGEPDAVLICLPVQGWDPVDLLEELQRTSNRVPYLFLAATAEGSMEEAQRLVKLGAHHYLPASTPVDEIAAVVAASLESAPAHAAEVEDWHRYLVGTSAAMRNIVHTIRLVARRRCTVLITGETGTGKEMVARAIHAASNRVDLPLVAVNCSAIPQDLLEAELFGHVKGAFTGAVNHRVGRFEQADQGTIFLDEVADLPLDLQAKLLRVLQEREFQRLGSSDTVRIDVRVIAACNADLPERVRLGKFREDLFYRLNVVPIQVGPLRERLSDVPVLVRHFLEKVCRQEAIPSKTIVPESLDRLSRYSWPGNVRQLENAVERAVAISGERQSLVPGDFPLPSLAATRLSPVPLPAQISVPDEGLDFEQTVGSIERKLLEEALVKSRGNKKAAADLLRLKRTTLTAKLKSLETAAARAAS